MYPSFLKDAIKYKKTIRELLDYSKKNIYIRYLNTDTISISI